MASVDKFEDHCWKDVIPADDLKLYAPYARETYVGPNVAFLAIDLYDAVTPDAFKVTTPASRSRSVNRAVPA